MAKKPVNQGKKWSNAEVSKLKTLAKINTPTENIANKLGRTEGSIYAKASEIKVSLKPKDKS